MSKKRKTKKEQKQPPPPVKKPGFKAILLSLLLVVGCIAAIFVYKTHSKKPEPAPGTQVVKTPPEPVPPTVESLKQEALDLAFSLKEVFPGQSTPLGLLGMIHYQFNKPTEALNWWQQSLTVNPRNAEAYFRMAEIYQNAGAFEKTAELCRKSLAINPRQPLVNGRLGEALQELGRPAEAVVALTAEVKLNPGSFKANNLLGQAYTALEQYEQALLHYQKAYQISPKAPAASYGLARTYTKLGQRDKAKPYHENFRKLRTDEYTSTMANRKKHSDLAYMAEVTALIHNSAGEVYQKSQQPHIAETHWKRAALLDPKNADCRQNLSDLHLNRQEWAEALTYCNQLVRINPKNPVYHLNKGTVLGFLRRLDESEKSLRYGLQLAPRSVTGHHALLQVLMHNNRNLPDAKIIAQRLTALEKKAEHYAMLSQICQKLGDRAGALAAIKQATLLEPGNREIRAAYNSLHERQ